MATRARQAAARHGPNRDPHSRGWSCVSVTCTELTVSVARPAPTIENVWSNVLGLIDPRALIAEVVEHPRVFAGERPAAHPVALLARCRCRGRRARPIRPATNRPGVGLNRRLAERVHPVGIRRHIDRARRLRRDRHDAVRPEPAPGGERRQSVAPAARGAVESADGPRPELPVSPTSGAASSTAS